MQCSLDSLFSLAVCCCFKGNIISTKFVRMLMYYNQETFQISKCLLPLSLRGGVGGEGGLFGPPSWIGLKRCLIC